MGVVLLNALSTSKDGIIATTYKDDYINRGNCFSISNNFEISAAATRYIALDPTGYEGFAVVVFPPKFQTTYGYVTVNILIDTDYTSETELTLINRNANSSNTAKTKLYDNATGDIEGTSFSQDLVGYGVTNQSSGGGTNVFHEPLWIDKTKRYALKIQNNSGKDIIFNIKFVIFEI